MVLVQHTLTSSRLTPVEWADLWRHPSSMSRTGAARSAQQWSRLNVWSNAKTGVNSPTYCWQTPCNGSSKCHIQSTCRYMASSRGYAEGQLSIRVITDTIKMWSARRWTSDMDSAKYKQWNGKSGNNVGLLKSGRTCKRRSQIQLPCLTTQCTT